MDRRGIALLTAAVLLATFSTAPAAPQDAVGRIREASSVFVGPADPSVTTARVRTSLLALLDVTAEVCPESQYQAEIRSHIRIARDLVEKDSIFNDKARQYLSFAYRMMTNGRKYEPPRELDEFVTPSQAQDKARQHAARLVETAIAELKAARPAESARVLLELALMIVTPVRG